MKRTLKRVLAFLLALAICVSTMDMNVFAEENTQNSWEDATTQSVYEGENYRVTYLLTGSWNGGYTANVRIENTGNDIIHNWYLDYDSNDISSIWNAEVHSYEDGQYIIKNLGWNQDIAIGGSTEFGFVGSGDFLGFPQNCKLLGEKTETNPNDYTIEYHLDNDWDSGFTGTILITNNTDTPIEDWTIEFDFNGNIFNIWNGVIDSQDGNHYVIKNAEYNSNIIGGETISFAFIGNSDNNENTPCNISLYNSVISNKENVELTIDTSTMKKDDSFDFYYLTDKTVCIDGMLSASKNINDMCYEVIDLNGNVIEKGNIDIADSWNISDIGFGIGANIIVVTATTKKGINIQDSIIVFNNRFDNLSSSLDLNDDDGDKISNYVEQFFGTDCNSADTDNDCLNDYEELLVLGTSPLLKDTNNNGILDSDEDADDDGLTAIQELMNGTNPFYADTDDDGLNDGDEINVYFTNPLIKDTDCDGVNDGKEIEIKSNPLVAEKTFKVVANAKEDDSVKVSVETVLSGNQVDSLTVEKYNDEFLFPDTMPGYIGGAYDFSVNGTFESATLLFEFDKNLLSDASFEPVIYYFNEETQLLEELETTIVGNVASTEVKHFSTYILLNRTVFQDSFKWQDVWSSTGYSGLEVVLVIDDSGSMLSNDSANKRLTVAKNLIDKLPDNSKVGIVKFTSTTSKLTATLTDDKEQAKSFLTTKYFGASGGTNMYSAINSAFSLYESTDDTVLRMMVVLSDGITSDTSLHSSVVTSANNKKVKIHTVGLGSSSSSYFTSYLKPLSNNTAGAFYLASNASQLEEIYNDINKKIDIEIDSDGDGIADYYEENMVMFNGVTIRLDKNNPDSDGDGLKDGEEIAELNYQYNDNKTKVIVTGKILSNPLKVDSDDDGILDINDPEPYRHFGLFNNNIDFKLTNSMKAPYNSAIEAAKKVTMQDYDRIWRERAADTINNEYLEALYILNIQTRAYMLLGTAFMGNGVLLSAGELIGKKIDINDGCYFLAYYLSCLGGYVEYDGTFPAVKDENGLEKYNNYVNKLLDVCESGTKSGKAITFTQIDAACGDTPINYCMTSNLSTLNYWLAVKGGHIGMSGKCSFDGSFYNLELIYCVQDYYDFYYENPNNGLDSIGLLNNDEMAFLKLFGAAETFENCGVYRVRIKWKKGQSLSEATQTPLGYSYIGKE